MQGTVKPRLIFSLLDTPAFGGAEQYLLSHLKHFNSRGYAVFLATNNRKVRAEIEKRLKAHHGSSTFTITHAPYRLDAIGNWKGLIKYFLSLPHSVFWLLYTLLRLQKEYTVICYLPGFSDRLTFSPFIKMLGLPLVWIDIAPLEPLFARLGGFPKWLYNATKQLPDHIVCTSQWTLDSIHRVAGIPKKKLTKVYPGIPQYTRLQIQTYRSEGKKLFKKLGLDKKMVIGFVGRLAQENEVQLVIEAVALLKKNGTLKQEEQQKLRLLIIGDGPNRPDYQARAHELGISEIIQFAGFVPEADKYALLSCCDVFTFTRAWDIDGFGITTIEAMSLGVASITSDFGPQKEVIIHNKSGLRFIPHSAKSLATRIQALITHPELRVILAHEGKKSVAAFGEDAQLQKAHEVIKLFLEA